MGLVYRLQGKKQESVEKVKEQTTPQPSHPTNAEPPPGRRIKKYTSEGNLSMNKFQTTLATVYLFLQPLRR